jgi:MarC family membrane protein
VVQPTRNDLQFGVREASSQLRVDGFHGLGQVRDLGSAGRLQPDALGASIIWAGVALCPPQGLNALNQARHRWRLQPQCLGQLAHGGPVLLVERKQRTSLRGGGCGAPQSLGGSGLLPADPLLQVALGTVDQEDEARSARHVGSIYFVYEVYGQVLLRCKGRVMQLPREIGAISGPPGGMRPGLPPSHPAGVERRIQSMSHTIASAFILLLLVLNPFGTLPIFLSVMKGVAPQRRVLVALREACIAFAVLLAFMLGGDQFLRLTRLSERALEVAGGVILLLVSIRIIFASGQPLFDEGAAAAHTGQGEAPPREPLIFPIAVPLLAGPSAMATVLLLASRQPDQIGQWVMALAAAIGVCALVLLSCRWLHRWLGDSVVRAIEKLMGLVLCAMAVEMILAGIKRYFWSVS